MEVYLLVNHEQEKATQSESWTYVRLPSGQENSRRVLSDAYRHMPDLLQLVVLLHAYDGMDAGEIADLLECGEDVVTRLLQKADRMFAKALGQAASEDSLYEMLEYEIENNPLPPEMVERVRQNLCETLFGAA